MAESKGSKKPKRKNKKGGKSEEDDSTSVSSDSVIEADQDDDDQIGRGVGTAEITVNRDEYLQAHRDLTFDLRQLQMKNNILHRRLADYYNYLKLIMPSTASHSVVLSHQELINTSLTDAVHRHMPIIVKRKLEHVLKPLENSSDLEEKYQLMLFAYEELKVKEERDVADLKAKISAIVAQYENRLEKAEQKFDNLQELERNTGTGLIYSKKGKPIADKTVQRFLILQRRKSEQSSALWLRYIRVRNAVAETEAVVRKLEMIGPGLYVAQFQQLDIDHHNFMTKIEEREDELIKNRNKCTEHNQILAHIREKMHHTDEVIDFTETDLGDAEIKHMRAREDLGHVKGRRDKLRWALQGEQIKAGLLTRKDLLRDFQDASDEVENLRERKRQLEEDISNVTHDLREARKRIQFHHASQTQHANQTDSI